MSIFTIYIHVPYYHILCPYNISYNKCQDHLMNQDEPHLGWFNSCNPRDVPKDFPKVAGDVQYLSERNLLCQRKPLISAIQSPCLAIVVG